MKKFKYLSIFIIPIISFIAFSQPGLWTLLPVFVLFGVIPVLELFFQPNKTNFDEAESAFAKADPFYDRLLYTIVFVHIGLLVYYLNSIGDAPFGSLEFIGRTITMGFLCGVFGINVGHELGHRSGRFDRFLGNIALLTSLEMHFNLYHNSGHHYNVATPNDPATAKKNEWLYTFWFRSQIGSYFQAWSIEQKRLKKLDQSFWSLSNRMIQYMVIQIGFLFLIYYSFGAFVLMSFFMAAVLGILTLETVNYIEHYGLLRKKTDSGRYERVQHWHSWNSDHLIGRLLLFELSRHSDHHYKASKHYQVLDSYPESPQMPTGYPGMMLFAFISPLWVWYMNRRLEKAKLG